MDIVVTHKSHLFAVRTPHGRLLWTAIAQRFQFIIGHMIDIVNGRERTAIDAFRLCLDQQSLTRRTHHIVVNLLELGSTGLFHIKKYSHLLARFEGILYDLLSISRYLGVRLTIRHRGDSSYRCFTKSSFCNLL